MEYYDVIIIGAGIAGCGLAYNLKRIGYEGKVLIIDGKEVGANAGYGYRSIEENLIKEYNFPFEHIFKDAKIGINEKTYFNHNIKYYFINYKKACKYLLKKSQIKFSKQKAIDLKKNILKTNKEKYFFKILIDCSGHNFFGKKLLKQKLPSRYFVGKTEILKNKIKPFNKSYYHFNDSGYVEDLYLLNKKTIHGDWQYTKKIDFEKITIPKKNLRSKYIKNPIILKEYNSVIPTAPALPIIHKNIAFLGDSFGNSYISAFGIPPALDSSKILARAIKEKNLTYYKKTWKKKYLNRYIQYLTLKYDSFHNSKFSREFKKNPTKEKLMHYFEKYPEILDYIFNSKPNLKLPNEIKKLFPKRTKITKTYYYLYLKLRYFLMDILY